jgi:hypothetical protein
VEPCGGLELAEELGDEAEEDGTHPLDVRVFLWQIRRRDLLGE